MRRLQQACEALEFGFFFEEGGCWGMALALREECESRSFAVQLCVRESDFVHAFVAADEIAMDYKGVSPLGDLPEWTTHTVESFIAVAKEYGVSGESLDNQVASARAAIRAARQFV